jgi:hypothetical protein
MTFKLAMRPSTEIVPCRRGADELVELRLDVAPEPRLNSGAHDAVWELVE